MENQHENVHDNALSFDVEEQKIISLNKFIFLCLISFGLYPIWWIYKAWRFFQEKEQSDIMPAPRTIFSIIFLYELLTKILAFARDKGYTDSYSIVTLYAGFTITTLLSRLPDPYSLLSIGCFVFLIPAFKALNFAKQNSTDFVVTEQSSYSGRQIVLIIAGTIFGLLILLGMIADGMF